jgi:hypothetical protein
MPNPDLNRLREAIVDPTDVDSTGRIEAARQGSSDVSVELGINMVRLAFGLETQADARNELRSRFNGENGEVVRDFEDQLLRTLVGMALVNMFTRVKYSRAVVPALAARCARHTGRRAVHPDVTSFADAYLAARAEIERRPPVGAGPDPADDLKVLQRRLNTARSAEKRARDLAAEADALLTLSMLGRFEGESALSIASQLAVAVRFTPPGPKVRDLLSLKIDLAGPADEDPGSSEALQPPPPTDLPKVPTALRDFCPALTGGDDHSPTHDVEDVVVRLDQLLLVREFERRDRSG